MVSSVGGLLCTEFWFTVRIANSVAPLESRFYPSCGHLESGKATTVQKSIELAAMS